ncbi:FUSC family protein [Curtobacterium luteum]|uniref:FUSC family protein n=1 Tax=Curtobacterium luteum TaxID=33881 RepID=UPI0007365DFC|nr:FUSC family protein [Curtobacterium luteum]
MARAERITGAARRIWRWSRDSGTQPRLLLAGKAALAATIAWVLAKYAPGVAAEYPYYAPLGAIVAMRTTVFAGIRSGVQTLVGITLGVLIAWLTMLVGDPGVIAVALAVGLGVLVSGFRILGEGYSWVPMAALFVLLVGGGNAEGYSFAYIVQMAIGITIGLAVNFAVFPPLHFWDAERRIDQVNGVLAQQLDDLADVLVDGEPDTAAWDRQQERLDKAIADVRDRVATAQESRRMNPRGALRGSRARLQSDGARFRAVERAAWYTTDLTELVARSGPVADNIGRPDSAFAEPFAAALRQVACVVRGDCPAEEGDEALAVLERALDASRSNPSRVTVTASAIVALRGVIESEKRATEDVDTETGPFGKKQRGGPRQR